MGNPYRILLADDDEAILFTIEEMLKLQGWECTCVTSATQVASRLREGDFDILITDHMMPGNERLELFQIVNLNHPELPIIVITGNASLPFALTSLQQEAFDYIPKPLDMDYLLKRVKEGAERYRLQKALRESEERSRALLSAIPDILFLQTREGTFVDYYAPAHTQLYTSPTQIRGRKAEEILPQAIAEKGLECIGKALRTGKLQSFEYELPIQAESHHWEARIVPCGDNMALTIVRNITDRKKSEEALMKSSRLEATATLAGGIAHDFNNLMVGVLGNAELLKIRLAERPDALEMLSEISNAAKRAGDLAGQILAFARGGKYQPKVLNLNTILDQTLRLHERSISPRIRIERFFEKNLWNVLADSTQMSQVIMNLCINAAESIKGQGLIQIKTCNVEIAPEPNRKDHEPGEGRSVLLSVEDTGQGMTPDVVSKVFEPFFTTKFQGRGLGLSAVHGIITNHGGHITISSQPGRGSCFKIYLPVTELQRENTTKPAEEIPVGTETILVIDDEQMVLDLTKNVLRRLGYQILMAHHGKEALKIAKNYKGKIHLAILDMGMPVLGGSETYPLLKEILPNLKILICSGYELDAASQALLDAGASGFIQKPFSVELLGPEIRKTLDQEE